MGRWEFLENMKSMKSNFNRCVWAAKNYREQVIAMAEDIFGFHPKEHIL